MKLTNIQIFWLRKMSERARLSARLDNPPLRVMNNLARKGLCKNIMDTFFEITEEGKEWCSQQRSS